MATNTQTFRHTFGGGWATDFGPTVDIGPDQSGHLVIPFLLDAENVVFELDGGPHKIGGTTKINSSAVGASGVVTGIYDFWKQGTAGNPLRRRICHEGVKIFSDADDGVFTNQLATGLTSGATPSYNTFDDILIISSDSTVDVPKSWDMTTFQNLAGTPPRFSFSCTHKNRVFAAGVYGNPSTVYYSVNVDPEDWVGAGSGTIQVNPNDGDIITGLASYKDDLWVFKGPNKGSIHRITGSSNTDFALVPFIKGVGASWHNAIFPFGDDLGFVTQFGTITSVKATASFGDFNEVALSRPINKFLSERLNFNKLKNIWAMNDATLGFVLFCLPIDASSTNNCCILMDYRFNPVRWAYIPAYALGSLGLFVDSTKTKRIYGGSNNGFVKQLYVPTRAIDGSTSIAAKVTTPYLNYSDPMVMKTISQAAVGISPKGSYNLTFGWTRDGGAQQTQTMSQGGSDVLGSASANQFTLGTSSLAGSQYIDVFMELETGGEFRSIQYQVTNNGLSEDLEVHSISASVKGGAVSTEN